jgi:lysyl-tRNA synthetase class 2
MGHVTVASVKSVKAGKLFNDLCGFNKKNKLGLPNPTMEQVEKWINN